MWLTKIPWASCILALPFLTILALSKRYYESKSRRHKKLTDWARQIVFQLRRWFPNRYLVVVADYSYAVLEFLATCQQLSNPVTIITRLRLDAALYQPAPPYTISLYLQCINSVNQVPLTRGKMPRLRCLVWGWEITRLVVAAQATPQPIAANARSRSSSSDRFSTRVAMYQMFPWLSFMPPVRSP